jgi:phosphoribosyl 1,2-cyclic phosphodiesterase
MRIVKPGETVKLGPMSVDAFELPHDAAEPVGYSVCAQGFKIAVATDMGHASESVRRGIKDCDALLLESNHDVEMLMNGSYPKRLKDRIKGARGHLSNDAAGALLLESASSRLKHVYLGHLSEENNSPLIALCVVSELLERAEVQIDLMIADRHHPSRAVEL